MPRQPRLDAPGLLQHVMARGIERRKIFLDDKDRKSFLERCAGILEETQTQCYAWALIPNHFHLLLRTGPTPLSKVMRKLMTGYAVTFNKRHKRSGHLFQNRYKSVICEEDPYLLELIRYIHLNPLRAKLVQSFDELDRYPWTGHSAILGYSKNPLVPSEEPKEYKKLKEPKEQTKTLAEKTIEDLLLHFGETQKVARRVYRDFVEKGIAQGRRPEFQGGGLVRSAGGNKTGLLGRPKEEREKGDARILGTSGFVNEALMQAGEDWEKSYRARMPLEELIKKVASQFNVQEKSILSASRKRNVSDARGIICCLAVNDFGYSTAEVGRALGIRRVSAAQCVARGKKMLLSREIHVNDKRSVFHWDDKELDLRD
ncbi:bacterial DnaA protein helix-turn-helix domain protein [delta proteobacterium NaphS2]|nr:bacterial DnaA protein helix-turn-helix domain protein [delta proteobacterium NaphS2]